ncbi:rho guanine nucleotide exchange factor 28-like isoform X1 [Cyprinodon tularosa]|uniref:rho guanine nucleotide exchange factor 28-like isoform X1 n=1 Tax=Cyprinodon tularosa TaxID=77115 RepID=UPI0018E22F41|nr:rho guanine nucleotide exchange factor 28-like isoform X1 [Cyprinodon tularosa]
MDSDSDSPFNYSWPSFPRMKICRKMGKKEKSQSIRESQASSPTWAAAARLSAMIHGKDQVYANAMLVDKVEGADIKYRSPGDEEHVSPSSCWDSLSPTLVESVNCSQNRSQSSSHRGLRGSQGPGQHNGREAYSCASPPYPFASSSPSFPSSPLASAIRLFEGAQRRHPQMGPSESPASEHREFSLTDAGRGLSPGLECDSEEDDILGHSYSCSSSKQRSILQSSSGEERDSFDTSPDFSRSHSETAKKSNTNSEEAEVRLRSYSYSSPKARPSRPLLNRDSAVTDLEEDGTFSSGGRSLLQALSLSKSLSRLNQVKQRAFNLTETAKEKRALGFRKRAQSAEEEGTTSLQHLTLTEFLKEIEDEEWDKYIIPSKVESEKYKVSRTFSFLKSRMSSTRSKTKVKGKETKEGKEKSGASNGHQFISVSTPAPSLCVACDKPVSGKDLLQCSNCSLNVHKTCRESVAVCGKKLPERNPVLMKSKTMSLPHSFAKEVSPSSLFSSSACSSPSSSGPTMAKEKRETVASFSKSQSISIDISRCWNETRVDSECNTTACTNSSPSEDGTPVTATPPFADLPISTKDTVDAPLLSDLSADLLGLEAESWSLAVCPEFCREQDRRTIKRQDVIYELMQTELHHIQTLTVMSEVFRRGMLEELQLDSDCVARIFPCLDPLLLLHRNLFRALQECRQAATQKENSRNYLIHQIGDVLLQQFSDENAEKMKQVYAEFCSHHADAVNLFKELQQQNKKFQNFVRQQSNNSLVRRREVPEFILLVTQRITKYPVLVEKILQYTQEGSREHSDLSDALAQIREIITAVDLMVGKYERSQELQEVLARLETKSIAKLKNNKIFRKQDLHSKHRALQHKGLLYWKTATGRLKDTLALLLTDVLVFLQEKDQRFVFASVDQKPPVIPLQKLIVREVANEERGMFLISASSVGPEMYEVHTITKEERNAWMRHIRQAVESCPEEEEEEERATEAEEARQAAEVRVQKISKFQETLLTQDQQICQSLEEKLQLYAELTELTLCAPESIPHPHLLVGPAQYVDIEAPRQASSLLTAALKEAENLINILQTRDVGPVHSQNSPVQAPECCSYNSHGSSIQESPSEPDYLSTLSISSNSLGSDCELAAMDNTTWSSAVELKKGETKGTLLKVTESVQSLTQLLYSLQAAVTLQDSFYEVQKLLLQEGEKPQLRSITSLQTNLEQEKQRNTDKVKEEKKSLERKKEDADEVQKLQAKLKQELQRWEKECLAREKQQTEHENMLEQREQQCLFEATRLRCEREELEAQLQEYQQNLDRLREGQRSVERDKERIEAQQRLLQSWRHSRQSSLPVTIPLDGYKVPTHSRTGSFDGNFSLFKNKSGLLSCVQQNHLQQPTNYSYQHALSLQKKNNPDGLPLSSSCAADRSLSASLCNSLNTLLSQTHSKQPLYGTNHSCTLPSTDCLHPFSSRVASQQQRSSNTDATQLEKTQTSGSWRSGITGHAIKEHNSASPSLTPLLPPQAYLSLEGQNGEEGVEENIVYL